MIFDKLCSGIENHLPHLVPVLRQTKLFIFSKMPQDVLPQTAETLDPELWRDNFFLPFQHVAVEDPLSCILMWDGEPGVKGLAQRREWVECAPLSTSIERANDGKNISNSALGHVLGIEDMKGVSPDLNAQLKHAFVEVMEEAKNLPKDTCILTWGHIRDYEMHRDNGQLMSSVAGDIDGMKTVAGREQLDADADRKTLREFKTLNNNWFYSVKTAIEELIYFNDPQHFVVEVTPKKARDPLTSRLIPRAHERPTYTMLKPKEIRDILRLPHPTGRHLTIGHDRRAHFRTLRSEKFKNKRGQQIPIDAVWVGPSEGEHGNKKYKVLLDR